MITHLFDTNAVIMLVGARSSALLRRVEQMEPGRLGLCSIVAHELYFGAYKSQRIEYNLETVRLVLTDFVVLDFDREDARAAGEIRADLRMSGSPIGPYDVLIAGQAKVRRLTLVTNNVSEFQRVKGLRVEDWTID